MSKIRIKSIKIKNYRSFGEEQSFVFPTEDHKKPVAIVGYNNSGKTNLMNSILYGLGEKYVSENTFEKSDLHNLKYENLIEIKSDLEASNYFVSGWSTPKTIAGPHTVTTSFEDEELSSKVNPSFFGANKHYNIFYINFHEIKDQISTQKNSWGSLKSFLAKHIKKIVDNDSEMLSKKDVFISSTLLATKAVLEDSNLEKFISDIKKNYSTNLRENNCEVEFGLPDYEDIFLQMMFKIGLNGDTSNLVPLDHFGDGYISMFVMAVIQAIAESNTEDRCLFLFEEPESFLHENHQEYFYKMVLCQLAEKGHQVIYTTHSDRMVDIFNTKGLIRLEFDEESKQTVKKYNNVEEFIHDNPPDDSEEGLITLEDYNQYITTIEPNLNKLLFSRKVILVEGPNDVMAYKYAIEQKVESIYKVISPQAPQIDNEEYNIEKKRYAETYLNFNNLAIVPHHGKSTALLLMELCKHIGLDYYIISDWDFDHPFDLSNFQNLHQLHESEIYKSSSEKAMITTNWKLINNAQEDKIHFNVRKLETVLGYDSSDKDSAKIWKKLQEIRIFDRSFFPENLENYLDFDNPQRQGQEPPHESENEINEGSAPTTNDGEIKLEDIPF